MVDYVLRNTITDTGEEVGFTTKPTRSTKHPVENIPDLDFADDIAFLSDDIERAQRLLLAAEERTLSVHLSVNKGKTEYMKLKKKDHSQLHVQEGPIKEVDDFKYLGS